MSDQMEDKAVKGPKEAPPDPVVVAAQLLAGWAAVLRKDEAFQAVMTSIPRNLRRELARRFAYLLLSLRDEA